jgi:hypothetical protein
MSYIEAILYSWPPHRNLSIINATLLCEKFNISCVRRRENPHYVTEHEHDSTKVNVWYALMKNKVIGPFLFEEPTVTGDTFLAMMENTFLCHVLLEQFSSWTVHHPTSPIIFMPYWTGSFPDHWIGKGGPILQI